MMPVMPFLMGINTTLLYEVKCVMNCSRRDFFSAEMEDLMHSNLTPYESQDD